jgi:CHAT domain-containing protein/tetratricopeptide (TPR) repeat protein
MLGLMRSRLEVFAGWVALSTVLSCIGPRPAAAQGNAPAGGLAEAKQLNDQGDRLFEQRRYADAKPLYMRALVIREKALGPSHPDVAEVLDSLGNVYTTSAADRSRAEALLQRALAIYEKAPHVDGMVVHVLNDLAVLHEYQQDYKGAQLFLQRAIALRENAVGADALVLAQLLNDLALVYGAEGDDASAVPLQERALAIREKALGPVDLLVAVALNNLALTYKSRSEYARAAPLFERALAIREKALRPDDPLVAESLNNLAKLYKARGDYTNSLPLFERALAIREKALGPDDPLVAQSLNDLAYFHEEQGDYLRAEPLIQRALAIRQRALGPEHPDVATSLESLAILYDDEGDHARAETLHLRALDIQEKAFGPDHPQVATTLNRLGLHYCNARDFARAEPLYLRALAIREKALNPESREVGATLSNLGILYEKKGEPSRAEAPQLRALAIFEKVLGPKHRWVATALSNLARTYQTEGDYAHAEALELRALAIYAQDAAPGATNVVYPLNNLAMLYWAKGDVRSTVEFLTRSMEAREKHVASVITGGSEEQRRLFLADSSFETDQAISFNAQGAPQDGAARRVAMDAILLRKGRLLDALVDTRRILRAHMTAEDAAALDRLRAVDAELARQSLAEPPAGARGDDWRKALGALGDEANVLEAAIAARSVDFRVSEAPVTLDSVRNAIPADAALVEIAAYSPYNPRSQTLAGRWPAPRRYAAYTLRATGDVAYADLGEVQPIDDLVARLRTVLADPSSDPRPLARALDERVGRPLRALVGDAVHVLLAPDGALNLVPFDALVDERGNYLVGRYVFTYLTTGRDLLRLVAHANGATSAPVIVASPDFGPLPLRPAATDRAADLGHATFPPLPGTAEEGRAIAALFPGAVDLQGDAATKAAVDAVRAPWLLHIATHGFFLDDAPPSSSGGDDRGIKLDQGHAPPAHATNPLVRSGLALTGANLHEGDGILTALEATAIDLWGTKLVVLSACETGVGEVKNGDGVYGMRRALVLAGAESEVMTLWKVDDAATRDLMIAYYGALRSGGGRTEALREAQLAMLADGAHGHPYYWASFIPIGDWRSLAGAEVPMRGAESEAAGFSRVHGACGCRLAGAPAERASGWGAACGLLAAAAVARRRKRMRVQAWRLTLRCTPRPSQLSNRARLDTALQWLRL